jgi:hypothetical protein
MPDLIRRRHLTVIPDDPNYDISADEWNDSLVVQGGGANGDLMVKNTAVADGWSFASTFGGGIDLSIANLTISGDLTVGGTTTTTTLLASNIQAMGVDVMGNLSVTNATFTGTLIAANIQAQGVDIAGNLNVGGIATAPTAPLGTATTQLATTAFVLANMAVAGGGTVNGPATATNNDIVLFNGATGALIKDSGVLMSSVALLASPAFTGVPTAPTAPLGTNTIQLATTAFVRTALGGSQVVSLTGTQNDLALTAGVRLVRCTNATKLTITGMSAGYDGQVVTIMSIGAGEVHFSHQDVGSVAANRYINVATSVTTPLAPNIGRATYIYDAMTARWRLTGHDQGSAIPYVATWGALAGSPTTAPVIGDGTITASYLLWGKVIDLFLQINFGPGTTYGNGYWTISVPAPLAGTSPVGTGFITTTVGITPAAKNHPVICTIPANEIVIVLTSSENNVGGLNAAGTDPTSPLGLGAGDVMRVALASYPIA